MASGVERGRPTGQALGSGHRCRGAAYLSCFPRAESQGSVTPLPKPRLLRPLWVSPARDPPRLALRPFLPPPTPSCSVRNLV